MLKKWIDKIKAEGFLDGLDKGRIEGVKMGVEREKLRMKKLKDNVISFADELDFALKDSYELSRREKEDLKGIVNDAKYDSFRRFIFMHSLILEKESKGKKEDEKKAMELTARNLKSIIADLDSMKIKSDHKDKPDPYDLQ